MTKTQIMNDIKFRQRCGKYGLDWKEFDFFYFPDGEYVISLFEPFEEIYVLFDKNYNTICIEKCDWIVDYEDLTNFVKTKYKTYSSLADKFSFERKFSYPFESYTLKQIIDLSNRVEIMETNHGHTLCTRVNGDWYDRNYGENEENFQLLSYIKFLGEEIKQYFLLNYHMQTMGFEVPDVYSYVRSLISKVNVCVDYHLEYNKRPWPSDILSSIGQNYRDLNMDGMLYDVADLLMREKGFKVKNGSLDKIEKIELQEKKKDLSIVAKGLLEILELSDEELKIKEKKGWEKHFWKLKEDIVEEQGPRLTKKKPTDNQ